MRRIDEIRQYLDDHSEGRNRNCWPVCGFGWKDADLEPEGCTGIRSLKQHWGILVVEVGGHKTVCPIGEGGSRARKQRFDSVIQEEVSDAGYDGYWSGDDWTLHFKEHIEFDLATVNPKDILLVARAVTGVFSADMAALSRRVDDIHEECETGKPKRRSAAELAHGDRQGVEARLAYHTMAQRTGIDPLDIYHSTTVGLHGTELVRRIRRQAKKAATEERVHMMLLKAEAEGKAARRVDQLEKVR